tara:strand:+ start:205 stop:363 length:159 start_codon:yes stop_codon:yes gene_type:complete
MEILILIVLICTLSEEPVVEEEKIIEIPEEAVNVEEVHAIAEALKAIGNVRG